MTRSARARQSKGRTFKRQLKNQKHRPRLCPVCNAVGFAGRTKRTPEV